MERKLYIIGGCNGVKMKFMKESSNTQKQRSKESILIQMGVRLARLRMLKEKALHNQDVVLGDAEGKVIYVPAKDLVEEAQKQYDEICERYPDIPSPAR